MVEFKVLRVLQQQVQHRGAQLVLYEVLKPGIGPVHAHRRGCHRRRALVLAQDGDGRVHHPLARRRRSGCRSLSGQRRHELATLDDYLVDLMFVAC
jgi:hypothetical protein